MSQSYARMYDARMYDARMYDARMYDARMYDARMYDGDRRACEIGALANRESCRVCHCDMNL